MKLYKIINSDNNNSQKILLINNQAFSLERQPKLCPIWLSEIDRIFLIGYFEGLYLKRTNPQRVVFSYRMLCLCSSSRRCQEHYLEV